MPDVSRRALALSLAGAAALPIAARATTAPPNPDGALDVVRWNNHVYRIHLQGGPVGAMVAEFPYGEAPPLHVHNDADEVFHVQRGDLVLMVDGQRQALKAGQTAMAPRGAAHSFVVTSPEGASIFTLFTPGGFEGFFAAVEGLEIPRDMARIKEIAAAFALDIVGPPMTL